VSLTLTGDETREEGEGEAVTLDAHAGAHDLLQRAREGRAEIFTAVAGEGLAGEKAAADLLVRLRLADFADEGRTAVVLTNAGRYWALNGGYMGFLKEPPASGAGGGGRQRNPEFEALRFDYMRLRMNTFWWTFGLSIASFVISLVTLTVAYMYSGALFR
jgi:hypothetical protein